MNPEWIPWIVLGGLVIWIGTKIIRRLPAVQELSAYQDWRDDCRRRGVSGKDAQKELTLRNDLAKVMRLASARVQRDPANAYAIVAEEIAAAVKRLQSWDRHAAFLFKKSSLEWGLDDCLYPDVAKLARKAIGKKKIVVPKMAPEAREDFLTAMRAPR